MTQAQTLEYYLRKPYRLLITPDEEGFGIAFPDLPGCFSHAESWEHIRGQADEALRLWLTAMIEAGRLIPEPAGD